MGSCCSTPSPLDQDVQTCAEKTYLARSPTFTNQSNQCNDLCRISSSLYAFLCRHVVGTAQTVRTKRVWSRLTDNCTSGCPWPEITSGSFGEGLEMRGSDMDYVYIIKEVAVFEDISDIQLKPNKAAYFQIVADDTNAGFVKLSPFSSTRKLYLDLCEKDGSDLFLSNTNFKRHFSTLMGHVGSPTSAKFHGPCLSDNEGVLDQAMSLHSSSWSSQANAWKWRSRNSWPSSHLKAQVIQHGVLFVPIGFKHSPKENLQWRISFVVAEKLLIYSFTHTQLLCYALMKIVLKDLINTDPECEDLLCSYFIKNIIFWLSEELPISVWRPDNIVPCFMQCLKRLIYCVKHSVCVHYFIPENNMFENRVVGQKRSILLEKLITMHSFNWQCIFLSPQFESFHTDHSKIETNLFDVHFEQILSSKVIIDSTVNPKNAVYYLIQMLQKYRSSVVGCAITRKYSELCSQRAQSIQLSSTYSNKKLYRQYKTCQCYLMQGLYQDAVSGWLLLASMFYRMKQYKLALDVLSYSLQKCSPEKIYFTSDLCTIQRKLLRSEAITSTGLEKAFSILYMHMVCFNLKSSLIPEELEIEVEKQQHFLPPTEYCHFLKFLCYYHLRDSKQCTESLTDIIRTMSKSNKFVGKAEAYNCLGVAFQVIGDIETAKQAFSNAVKHDTRFNSALHRLSMLERS